MSTPHTPENTSVAVNQRDPNLPATPEIADLHTEVTLESGNPILYRIILAVIAVGSIALMVYSLSLGVGTFARPQTGLWPFLIGLVMLVATPFAYFIKEKFEIFNRLRVSHTVAMMLALIAFVALYPLVGYYLAGVATMIIITRFSASESWRNTLLLSLITPAVIYLIFGLAFKVPLSILPTWLG